jgi:Mn-dependent DtxR family transcriptional regulator
MANGTNRWSVSQQAVPGQQPSEAPRGDAARPNPERLGAALRYLYQCQVRAADRPVYVEDLAAALRVSTAEARDCVERLRDQGLAISTGVEAQDPCICLSLKGLERVAAVYRHRRAG